VPAKVVQVKDIPRTKSGKIVELAVRSVVHGEPVKNVEALANPAALDESARGLNCNPEERCGYVDGSSQEQPAVVDVQERLLPAIADGEAVLGNCVWLAGVARRVGVPVVVSEQYPEGLGRTADPLLAAVGDAPVVTKTHFSCVADGCLDGTAVDSRRQVVGTEAHVCVLQTVLELRWQGKEVFVVADAVGSRKPADREAALAACAATGSRSPAKWWPSNGCTRAPPTCFGK
jgi:hypothetical protein